MCNSATESPPRHPRHHHPAEGGLTRPNVRIPSGLVDERRFQRVSWELNACATPGETQCQLRETVPSFVKRDT